MLTPWAEAAYASALAAWRAGRLGHAQLICGPAALGKRALADALAARLLCTEASADHACGQCRGCRLRLAGSHPDYRVVTLEEHPKTGKMRTEIVVEQVRGVSDMLALTSQLGGVQAVLFDPADALNHAAANALLKTLEEPSPGRFLLLISETPHRLPATIRSRCQRIELRIPAWSEALGWLQAQAGEGAVVEKALTAAGGHPGLAAQWLAEGGLALRDEVRRDLVSLTGASESLAIAQRWAADAAALSLRLRFAIEFGRDVLAAGLGGVAIAGLTPPHELDKLGPWIEALQRVREQLGAPLKQEFLLVGVLEDGRRALGGKENRR